MQKQVEEKKRDIKLLCPNPCLMTTSEGHGDTVAEVNCKANLAAHGSPPLRAAVATTGGCQKALACALSSLALKRVSPHVRFHADELYEQLLSSGLSHDQMYRCGHPRPIPQKPVGAVWLQRHAEYWCRRTYSRCGSTFVTPEG